MRVVAIVCAAAFLAFCPTLHAHAQDPLSFYKGKTVDLYVGYSAGGGYDVYARALARHIGRFIPGNPTIVPKNMPGAGSLVLAHEAPRPFGLAVAARTLGEIETRPAFDFWLDRSETSLDGSAVFDGHCTPPG